MDDDAVMSCDDPNQTTLNLATLPIEVLDRIFGYLRPGIRPLNLPKYGDVSWLIDNNDDRMKRKTLHSLCRTTKRLRRSATPLLYADIHIVGWRQERKVRHLPQGTSREVPTGEEDCVRQLTRLIRTISSCSHLAEYIQVIRCNQTLARRSKEVGLEQQEEDLVLAMGEAISEGLPAMVQSLFNDQVAGLWHDEFKGTPAKAQLTLLLWLSPNISELTLETYNGDLSRILGLELGSSRPGHYAKLATINITEDFLVKVNDEPDQTDRLNCVFSQPESYDERIATFRYLPALKHYRHRYPDDIHRSLLGPEALRLDFEGNGLRNLSTLHLVDCKISMEQIIMTIRPCHRLVEFRFRLGCLRPYDERDDMPRVLDFELMCMALLQSKDTMRYLSLSAEKAEGRFSDQTCTTLAVGTLNEFTKLQTLLVPAMILTETPMIITYTSEEAHWDPDLTFPLEIVESLPTSITLLGLGNEKLRQPLEGSWHLYIADEANRQLAMGIERLPNLRAVCILHAAQRDIVYIPDLWDACLQKGIEYVVQNSLEGDAIPLKHYEINH